MSAAERTCPYCAETIKAAAIRCRWCGADLTVPVPTGAAETPPSVEPGGAPATTASRAGDRLDHHHHDHDHDKYDEQSAAGRLPAVAGRPVVLAVLAVLVLALGTVFVRMALVETRDEPVTTGNSPLSAGAVVRSERAKSAGLSAAARATERILSYHHRTLDEDVAAATRLLGDNMRAEYEDTMAAIEEETRKNRAQVEAVVVAASAISATEHDARALLFVNQTTTGRHLDQPRVDLNRVVVSLHRDGGDWIVTDLDAL